MRVLHAARLSQLRKGQTGIETADAAVHAWAEREGHVIVHVAADFKSGTVPPWKRPNLREWVTDPAKIAQYDAIVAYKFDRLSRGDDASTAAIEQWARDNGKLLITVSEDLQYPCEGIAGIRWDLAARMAHQEWLEISKRYRDMGATIREGGFHYGRAPYGYQSVPSEKDPRHKTLIPVPYEADVIRDMAQWVLDGCSLEVVAEKLNAQGRLPRMMKDGRQPMWRHTGVAKVLHNEVIAGRQKSLSGRTLLKVEAILSRDIWEKVIATLDARSKCKGRTGGSQSKVPAMLTSVIMCNEHGAMYRINGNAYYCRVKGCKSRIGIDKADGFVHEMMASDKDRDIVETVVPGDNHDADIADVKRDLAEAVEAEDFAKLPALQAELARLRALPASPTRVIRRESDLTVAQMWVGMADDTERRAYLLARRARVVFHRAEDGSSSLVAHVGQAQTL